MHKENPFKQGYDLERIGLKYLELKEFVFKNKYQKETIDFSNPKAVLALNAGILKTYYDIDWTIPKGQLCPPIPSRLDYLLQVNDFLKGNVSKVLDIGCGANLIYCILGERAFNWDMIASDINKVSIKAAENLIEVNQLKTDLRLQGKSDFIFQGVLKNKDSIDLTVCNPPFFRSRKEAIEANRRKNRNLGMITNQNNFGGVDQELWCQGGEVSFILKMIKESQRFSRQIKHFSSLVSRKESLRPLTKALKKSHANFDIISMSMGNKSGRILIWNY